MTLIKETIKTVLSVNYDASQKIAWEVLKQYADYKLPISLGEIIKKIPNIHLMTYSKIAALYGCKPNEVSDITGSEDGGILWYRPSKNDCVIAYDDVSCSIQRQRFTVAHELGHFFLGHYKFKNNSEIIGGKLELSDRDSYNIYEQEANYFAKRLLVPIPVLMDVHEQIPVDSYLLACVFGVSLQCSEYTIGNVNKLVDIYHFYPHDAELSLKYRSAVNEIVDRYRVLDLLTINKNIAK